MRTVTGARPSRRVPDTFARRKRCRGPGDPTRTTDRNYARIAYGQDEPLANMPLVRSAAPNLAVKPPTLTINGKNVCAVLLTVTLGWNAADRPELYAFGRTLDSAA